MYKYTVDIWVTVDDHTMQIQKVPSVTFYDRYILTRCEVRKKVYNSLAAQYKFYGIHKMSYDVEVISG